MIMLTRLNGAGFAVNPDLIQRADATPDTVVMLVDGTTFMVAEPIDEVINRIRLFRSSILALASRLETEEITDTRHLLLTQVDPSPPSFPQERHDAEVIPFSRST
jgi:flagellar protein FlbD